MNAISEKNHCFRSFVLSTVDKHNKPNSRTVILRSFNPELLEFNIYSDLRSKKIIDLKNSPYAQLLFYDNISLFQIIVKAELTNKNTDTNIFNNQPDHSKKNYTTLKPPGELVNDPYEISIGNDINFCELTFKANSFEVLDLSNDVNIRSRFKINNRWKGDFIVP